MKEIIQEANEAYEQGVPILTDQEFDLLADTGLEMSSRNFRRKVEHPFMMGSLDKIRSEALLEKWVPEDGLFCAKPKIDGLSIRLSYVNGHLTMGATRGNGKVGNDVTTNILRTNVLKELPEPHTLEVRVEAVIKSEHLSRFGGGNLRNIAAGMLGAKDPRSELELIDCIVIDVFTGKPMSWKDKWLLMDSLFPRHMIAPMALSSREGVVVDAEGLWSWTQRRYTHWQEAYPYAQDGLVLQVFPDQETPLPIQEGKTPKDQIAIKFGSLEADSVIQSIEWGLGLHGKLTPVLNIAPVELDGTTVKRVSASNYSLLVAAELGIGAEVSVTKSGDIIPYITRVITTSSEGLDIPCCPECGVQAALSDNGIQAICVNPVCEGNTTVLLKKTIALFGIDFIGDSTVEALVEAGHDTLEKIFALTEADLTKIQGFAERSASYIVQSLKSAKVSEAQVIKSAFFRGIGERKGIALLNHYGSLDNLIQDVRAHGMQNIDGFGPIQSEQIEAGVEKLAEQLERFQKLGVAIVPHKVPAVSELIEVCCTGTCSQYGRKELAEVLAERGYKMADSVTKNTKLLLCADPAGSSSKITKAKKLGIPIREYAEFLGG